MKALALSLAWVLCTWARAPRVPSYTETGLSLTSMALTRDSGPWHWVPSVVNVACGIQLMGVYNYLLLPGLRDGSDDVLLSGADVKTGTELFRDVKCSLRTAWQFADDKFGKDDETCSFAVACAVDLEQEIGPLNFRVIHESGKVCRLLATEDVHLKVLIRPGNATVPGYAEKKQTLVQFRSEPRKGASVGNGATTTTNLKEMAATKVVGAAASSEFVVCGVQSFRNVLSPFVLPMWVHHYASLGYRVALFDRYGLHSDVITRHFSSNSLVDYFPHTMLDKALHRNVSKESQKDFSYKVYYKEHLAAAKGVAPKVTLERNTGLLDREKMVTYDHCRLLYARARGILYVDTDEFLYCPAVPNSYKHQSAHQLATLHRLADEGVDEIRLDTYPYDSSSSLPSNDVSALQKCLQAASVSAASPNTATLSPPSPFSSSHACFSSRSTYPTWMKSADLGRRCPFHYNHWSCDGGKGGGRNSQCRCRVSVGPWMSLTHSARTDACHLMHFNPQQYAYQVSRNRRGARNKTEYDEFQRARVPDSLLATIKIK